MEIQEKTNYQRIEEAIAYIQTHFREQPTLDDIAGKVHLSPFHFQRLFTAWAGVSPKKFLQYISLAHAKKMLAEQASLLHTAYDTGLSGTSRLHDLFVNIEGMTPGEFKNGGESLLINYSFAGSLFGNIIIASTPKGICHISFACTESEGLLALKDSFPNAGYRQVLDKAQQNALYLFSHDWSKPDEIKLHLRGTPFQVKVWEALLRIPSGNLTTYGQLAAQLGRPGAWRAVGSAVGDNPVAFLIPCHRVIRSGGEFGQYHWGSIRKTAMIGWEAAQSKLLTT